MVLTVLSLIGVFWMLYTGQKEKVAQSKKIVTSQSELEDSVAEHHKGQDKGDAK